MPIFEFTCDHCARQFSALVGVVADARPPKCPRCGGESLTKRVSRFARLRAEDDAFEDLADESRYGDIENDPKAMRKWVKDMSSVVDEDMDGDLEEAFEQEMEGKPGDTDGASDDTIY